MKSKTSCSKGRHMINKTVLVKNITLFWPIWAVYMLYLLVKVPISLSIGIAVNIPKTSGVTNRSLTQIQRTDLLYLNIEQALSPTVFIVVAFIMAAITGMALYSYLFTSKSANWYHSLPVTRNELYFTNVFTGLLFMWLPQFVTFIISVLTCIGNGVGDVKPFADWFLMSLGVSLLFWSMVTFCAMFTGQMFAVPVYYLVINFLYVFIKLVIGMTISFLGFGLSLGTAVSGLPTAWLSPFYYLAGRVGFLRNYTEKDSISYVTSLSMSGGRVVAVYAGFAIVLLVLAAFCYKKRKLESAGDLLSFAFVKPVFRWGAGLCGGFGLAILLGTFLKDLNFLPSKHMLLFFAVILGAVCFFIAEMFVQKGFKVFGKRSWKECGCFVIALVLAYVCLSGYSSHASAYIPDLDDVASASITMDYEIRLEGEEAEKIAAFQRRLLEDSQSIEKNYDENTGIGLSISYQLKDGSKLRRFYTVTPEDEGLDLLKGIYEMECDADNYKKSYQEDYFNGIKAGRISLYDENVDWQKEIQFSKEEAQKVYDAILMDIEEGNMQKYNLSYRYISDDVGDVQQYTSDLSIEFYIQKSSQNIQNSEYYDQSFLSAIFGISDVTMSSYSYSETDDSREIYFSFGPDCTNVINALIEIGAIGSADELYTYPSSVG